MIINACVLITCGCSTMRRCLKFVSAAMHIWANWVSNVLSTVTANPTFKKSNTLTWLLPTFGCYWHCQCSMRSRVSVMIGCLSVCLSSHLTVAAVSGGCATECHEGRRYLGGWSPSSNDAAAWAMAQHLAANAGSTMMTATLKRLNSDLLLLLLLCVCLL